MQVDKVIDLISPAILRCYELDTENMQLKAKIAALQSEIDAFKAGEVSLRKRIAQLEGEEKTGTEIMLRALTAKYERTEKDRTEQMFKIAIWH